MDEEGRLLDRLLQSLQQSKKLNLERSTDELDLGPVEAPSSDADDQRAQKIADIYRQRVAAEKELCERAPHMAAFWGIAPATCQDLEQTLSRYPEIHVLQYFVCQERLLIFVTSAGGTRAAHANVSKERLTHLIRQFRQLIEMHGRWIGTGVFDPGQANAHLDDVARQLYDLLIAPVLWYLPSGCRICVVPHGVLHYLPFYCLVAPTGVLLIKQYDLMYSVSHSIFDWCYTRPLDHSNRRIVSFANPALGNPRLDLPMAEEQSRNLVKMLPNVQLFVGKHATREAFWQHAPSAGILALDLHNSYNRSQPLATALCFATDDKDKGALTVREIYQHGKGAMYGRLAVAAVCDGNLGEDIGRGAEDDLTTLARALHYAGYASVITSLWRVNDLSSWMLMESFYQVLLTATNGSQLLPAGAALRAAQRQIAGMTARRVLERCLDQRNLAEREDPSGLRAAWIDLAAVAWVEKQSGNLTAARAACQRAAAVFAKAPPDYGEIYQAAQDELAALEEGNQALPATPNYDQAIFSHPYYWGAYILLGRWHC